MTQTVSGAEQGYPPLDPERIPGRTGGAPGLLEMRLKGLG